jgi:putative hemin transport protein
MNSTRIQTLREAWATLKAQNPHVRIRNAAEQLGVSEAELLATQCGENVSRLTPRFNDILKEITSLGSVMALSRNDDAVHERKGVYLHPSLDNPHVGLFVGEDIDLRIFFKNWASAFSVTEMSGDQPRYSLQFFARNGEAIHKIYLTAKSDHQAFLNLVKKYKSEDQQKFQPVEPVEEEKKELPDEEIDRESFQKDWLALKDTHHFFGLLQKYKLSRTQALRLAPAGNYAVSVSGGTLRALFEKAAAREIPIMVFVGNSGIIQIHTGTVRKLVDHEEWFNVLDPDFNLHLREKAITESWIVRKPTEDGIVTSLECFDKNGKQIIQIFGKRKPGIPEMESWREIVADTEKNA